MAERQKDSRREARAIMKCCNAIFYLSITAEQRQQPTVWEEGKKSSGTSGSKAESEDEANRKSMKLIASLKLQMQLKLRLLGDKLASPTGAQIITEHNEICQLIRNARAATE